MTKQKNNTKDKKAFCSFCNKSYKEVGPVVEGARDVYICGACIDLCNCILVQERRERGEQQDSDNTKQALIYFSASEVDGMLINAVVEGGIETIIKFLIEKGANVNAKDDKGLTPLHHAGLTDDFEIVQLLVSLGADVHARDNYGTTPLHSAAWDGCNVDLVKFLVSQGADVNVKDIHGRTPLSMAQEMVGRAEIIEYLAGITQQNSNQ